MPKIFFKTKKNTKPIYYHLITKNNETKEILKNEYVDVSLEELDDKSSIVFYNDDFKTDLYLIANVDIGIEYKYNYRLKKYVTYLYNPYKTEIGNVDTYTLIDNKNLAYRKGKKVINIFVPANYDPNKKYGLLYFYDSQNLFRNNPSYTKKNDPYGGWQLDEVISIFNKDIIVVGIENADKHREFELSFKVKDETYATIFEGERSCVVDGKLDNLLNFVHETLHPFIKNKYSIDEENIGVGGASCGGLAAFLTGIAYPEIYKYILAYSPAFLLYENKYWKEFFKEMKFEKLPKIHIYSGANDQLEAFIYDSTKSFKPQLVAHGYDEDKIKETYVKEFPHNEVSWRLILPTSFDYLLK